MMVEIFFPLDSAHLNWLTPDYQKVLQDVKSFSDPNQMSLISVPDTQLASSLLFQAAVTCNTSGCIVVYIVAEPFGQLPKPIDGMPKPDPLLMNGVRFLYMDQYEQVIDYLSEIHHKCEAIPDVIIVQTLDWFANQSQHDSRLHSKSRLCALLSDTATFIAKKSNSGVSRVLASVCDVSSFYTTATSLYFKDIWVVKAQSSCPGAAEAGDEYEILHHGRSFLQKHQQISLVFAVNKDSLCLHRVVEVVNELPVCLAMNVE